ncbi:MAG: hypothetical protein ACRDJE_13825 [Dehalococcoidia bacterium]
MWHAERYRRQGVLIGLCALVLLVAGGVMVAPAAAQFAPLTPPARVFGTVFILGRTAPPGTSIVAFIGPNACGAGVAGAGGAYQLDVRSAAAQPGCGTAGAIVTFAVDGQPVPETVAYQAGGFIQRDLTVGVPPGQVAEVTVERWVLAAEEPCAAPSGIWCIQSHRLPPAPEPFARYRMLVTHRDGRVTQPTGFIDVAPNVPTAPVRVTESRGVIAVRWERRAPASARPCAGRIEGVWCVETVVVPPPLTSTAWYRLLVHQPNGTTDDPTGFIATSP